MQNTAFPKLLRDQKPWKQLLKDVAEVVRKMPLWKLQTVGNERLEFLYPNAGKGGVVELYPGVAYCFRKFHALISDLVRGAWARYIRTQNLNIIGESADLNEFLSAASAMILRWLVRC